MWQWLASVGVERVDKIVQTILQKESIATYFVTQPFYLCGKRVRPMTLVDQIRRMVIIVSKLHGAGYVPAGELVDYVTQRMHSQYASSSGCTLRTLQRDFQTIEELFGLTIRHDKLRGYYLAEQIRSGADYGELLLNFEILNAIDADSDIRQYVLPEHRRSREIPYIPELLEAIRERHPVVFDYQLFRHEGKIVHREVKPHYLKESQHRWYLIGYVEYDKGDSLRCFGMDRISHLQVKDRERFVRNEQIDIPALFRESFGIWNNLNDPVEEVVLRYDALDGAFIKTLPLHATQEILEEKPDSLTIRLHVRITNDFVMALLARSRSLEVIRPASLRKRIYDTCLGAAGRNKPAEDERRAILE